MKSLERRILRLEEVAPATEPRIRLRFGYVQRLPKSYTGERHVVIAKHLPERDGEEWVEFEEVPGPAKGEPLPDPRLPQYLDINFVESPKHASEE